MKKIYLLVFVIPILAIGQKNNTISVYANAFQFQELGISYEFKMFNKQFSSDDLKEFNDITFIVNASYSRIEYSVDGFSTVGSGMTLSFGGREYFFGNNKKGLYGEWLLTYGRTTFKDNATGFNGTASFISLFNESVGYKWYVGKNFVIDPYIGGVWKTFQIKGEGDIDNKNLSNNLFYAGLKVGYNF